MPSEVVVNKLVFEKLNIDTAIFDETQLFLDRLNVKRVDMAIFKDPYFISPQKWTPFFEKFGVLDIHVVGQARHEDLLLLARSNCHTFKVDGFVPDNCIVQELHRSARVALSPCLLVRGAKASKETIRVVLEECLKNEGFLEKWEIGVDPAVITYDFLNECLSGLTIVSFNWCGTLPDDRPLLFNEGPILGNSFPYTVLFHSGDCIMVQRVVKSGEPSYVKICQCPEARIPPSVRRMAGQGL